MVVGHARIDTVLSNTAAFLRDHVEVNAIYLFGSQVSGDTHEFSDIDIAVFSADADQLGMIGRMKLGAQVQRACGDDIEPHFFPAWALEEPPKGSFAEHVIKTGRRIV